MADDEAQSGRELVRERLSRREEKKRRRRESLDSFSLGQYEWLPITGFHLLLLGGLFEPFLYPSLVPLMLLMTHLAHDSAGVEAHARDAFNLTFFYSIGYALITAVCLITGETNSPSQVTIWHAPLMAFYGVLVLRAARQTHKRRLHKYPLWFRLVRTNGERSFMSNG